MSSPIDRLDDDGKAALTTQTLNNLLLDSSFDIINNIIILALDIINIGHSFLGMYGLHLNEHGDGKLVLNFVKGMRSILNCGSAKQKKIPID